MFMKSSHSADGSKGITGSTKQHISSRLRKAGAYASHLVTLLKDQAVSKAANEDILEARAYYMSLLGAMNFERQHWETALGGFSESRLSYASLAKSTSMKHRDIFQDLLTTTIDPSIRYAAYQLKVPRTTSIETIVTRSLSHNDQEYIPLMLEINPEALQDPTTAKRKGPSGHVTNVPKTIQWRSRTVSLEDSATAQALADVAAAEGRLSSFFSSNPEADPQAKAAAYDDILLPSQEAADATKTAIDELSAEGIAQSDRRMQSLQVTRTAVNYALVGWRVGRNRVLCGNTDGAVLQSEELQRSQKSSKNAKGPSDKRVTTGKWLTTLKERVALYDSTLQSLNSVKELPGVAADQHFIAELEIKRSFFAALKCIAIARAHALLQSFPHALCLFSRALDLVSSISQDSLPLKSETNTPPGLDITQDQVRTLHGILRSLVFQHQALVELHQLAEGLAQHQGNWKVKPLVERLDHYPQEKVDLTNLVTYPPRIKSIPVKPIFLDVAFNYIDYPGRASKMKQSTGVELNDGHTSKEEKREGKKGWFGFGR